MEAAAATTASTRPADEGYEPPYLPLPACFTGMAEAESKPSPWRDEPDAPGLWFRWDGRTMDCIRMEEYHFRRSCRPSSRPRADGCVFARALPPAPPE